MESNLFIKEFDGFDIPCQYMFDLRKTKVKDCVGCWSCWIKTPGRCINTDLDEFYKAYLKADKVIILSKVNQRFVSGNLKTLFDRMIPLFMPDITFKHGEAMHLPRYRKYPDVEIYYQGDFDSLDSKEIYENYLHRTFAQFYSKCEVVKPINQSSMQEISG
ncbi:MAG: hypothetical protein Q8S15_03435 [Erysipelotrichaceae bacterium]|nr:hypothetical protein [Erysipelotrichaceae bacterium]